MKAKRSIAVFTGTRAEYGLLRPVLLRLRAEHCCHVNLIVSGTHLSESHGHTLDEILADGFEPAACLPLDLSRMCTATGQALSAVGDVLSTLKPDLLVVLGDRYETFAAAAAAALGSVPVAHIHGGDITQGAIDDRLRHAITKLSLLHFTTCEAYRRRVVQLGEHPDRVWNVGSLGVENVRVLPLMDESTIRSILGVPPRIPYILCTFHPVTLEPGTEQHHMTALLQALEAFPDHHAVFTGANADAGGETLNHMLHDWQKRHPDRRHLFASLGVVRYLSAARYAACVAGNSSSGVVELPSLGIPVVDIGNRQRGRVRSDAVLHCPPEPDAIMRELTKALTPAQRHKAATTPNPYEMDGTSASIAEILLTWPLHTVSEKVFHDLP